MQSKRIFPYMCIILFIFIAGCAAETNDSERGKTENGATKQTEATFVDGKVVTINDHTFDETDLDFYTTMNKVQVILQKESAEGDTSHFDEQIAYYDFVNANLQNLIELYSIKLLAEEKNYFIPTDKALKEKKSFE